MERNHGSGSCSIFLFPQLGTMVLQEQMESHGTDRLFDNRLVPSTGIFTVDRQLVSLTWQTVMSIACLESAFQVNAIYSHSVAACHCILHKAHSD
jgi:hypothetical protein